ncbi:hypothetical protein EDC04DRAFT_1128630 [Pisolithus marmoratus]|nr:hypothetical protein EDC04DRAFT_1128630 [Pisolithus marmoratus]
MLTVKVAVEQLVEQDAMNLQTNHPKLQISYVLTDTFTYGFKTWKNKPALLVVQHPDRSVTYPLWCYKGVTGRLQLGRRTLHSIKASTKDASWFETTLLAQQHSKHGFIRYERVDGQPVSSGRASSLQQSVKLGYKQILETTRMDEGELRGTLRSLACAKKKVLRKRPVGKDIDEIDVFYFNSEFTDLGIKVLINSIQTKETPKESTRTQSHIDSDRKHTSTLPSYESWKRKKS